MRSIDRTSTLLAAALVAPLVLLLLVAAMTWRAERRVVAVADRVVHDYAAIAVWQYARKATGALHDEVMRTFGPAPGSHARSRPGSGSETASSLLAGRSARRSTFLDSARFAFVLDPATGTLDVAGGALPPRLLERLRALAATRRRVAEPHRVLFEGELAVAVWLVPDGEVGAPTVKGVAAPATALGPVFAAALRDPSLLPAVGAQAGGDLALRLTRRDGVVIFATAATPGATAATDTAGLQDGELRATLDIPAPLARRLLVRDLPASQLPSLALIIAVATVLAVTGLLQHVRGRALADARARFVANVSHELRTPLAQISMFAETLHLGRERSDAERRQFAGIVLSEARRLTSLVENVLRVSRDGGRGRVQPEPAEAALLVERAVSAFAPIAAAAGVHVDWAVDEALRVVADHGAFQQVMLNLLDNAVKHAGRSGRVTVTVRAQAGEARIAVDDAGPGVPPEWRARVFDPFVQVAGRKVAGAGIGLAIVRDLVQAHGGRVWIDDSPLGGARIAFTLPRAPALVPATA